MNISLYPAYKLIIDFVMIRDPENENKKCGEAVDSDERLFKLIGESAKENECREKCLKDPKCITMSAIWGMWCIGCKTTLRSSIMGATAYRKGK